MNDKLEISLIPVGFWMLTLDFTIGFPELVKFDNIGSSVYYDSLYRDTKIHIYR